MSNIDGASKVLYSVAQVGIARVPEVPLDVAGHCVLRSSSPVGPTSGLALRIGFAPGFGADILSYDFTAATLQSIQIRGNPIILAGGNVGIATTTPGSRLSVTGYSVALNGDGNSCIAQFTTGTGAQTDEKMMIGVVDGAYGWIQSIKAGTAVRALVLQPGGGGVGIGTTAPQGLVLSLNPGANASSVATAKMFTIGEATNTSGYYLAMGMFHDGTNWNSSIQATEGGGGGILVLNGLGGKVRIGSAAAPAYALDVAGQINATGFLLNGAPHLAVLAAGPGELPPAGGINLWLDEAAGRIAVRYRNALGVLKTGYITVE